jgi:hypothetical protein
MELAIISTSLRNIMKVLDIIQVATYTRFKRTGRSRLMLSRIEPAPRSFQIYLILIIAALMDPYHTR